ncbi:serine O-acetyltransferase [Nonomuraea sp. NPDC004297]
MDRLSDSLTEDLESFARRDLAASGDPAYVYDSYRCFHAIFTYRVAHFVHRLGERRGDVGLYVLARQMSEAARVTTGVDIHPAARIGRRFVVDHGTGTVIGQQVEIGDDCYLLQQVVLGARSIATGEGPGKVRRHPRLGNRVQIAGNVGVFGPVTIGDDCVLGPGVCVTTDIPSNSRVRLVSVIQVSTSATAPHIDDISSVPGGVLICGIGLSGLRPALLNAQLTIAGDLRVVSCDGFRMRCAFSDDPPLNAVGIGLFLGDDMVSHLVGAGIPRGRSR